MATSPLPALSSSAAKPVRIPRPATVARDALYLCAGLPAGIVTFSVLVTGLSLAAGLAITLVGVPVMLATLCAARLMGDVERRRAGWVLDAPVTRTARPWRGGIWARTKAAFTDVGAWRDMVWGLILMPLGIFGFTVAVTVWSTALGLLTSPLWYWALPDNDNPDNATLNYLNSHAAGPAAVRVVAGLVLIPVAIFLCRALADATARGARALLNH
ncbi:sensor domain-containing protein [Baekduia sp.]|uniref:sensor domain-containing protein n=1 Tax=Baekduia sp. TaxID=2600305 RepID=UPI002E08BF5D|nr:sensor domain-containing protein [Baekduia sp.]